MRLRLTERPSRRHPRPPRVLRGRRRSLADDEDAVRPSRLVPSAEARGDSAGRRRSARVRDERAKPAADSDKRERQLAQRGRRSRRPGQRDIKGLAHAHLMSGDLGAVTHNAHVGQLEETGHMGEEGLLATIGFQQRDVKIRADDCHHQARQPTARTDVDDPASCRRIGGIQKVERLVDVAP